MSVEKIIYIYPLYSSFVQKDIDIFRDKYEVSSFSFNPKGKFHAILLIMKQIFDLPLSIISSKAVFVMFAGYHSLIPILYCKLLKKPVFVILGGVECHSFPSIDYGNFRKYWLGKVTCLSLNLATELIPVHRSLMICEYTYYNAEYSKQGCMFFCNNYNLKYLEIVNGYDSNIFKIDEKVAKTKGSFITVLSTLDYSNFKRKGIDLLFEVAIQFPNNLFTIVGINNFNEDVIVPENVRIVPLIKDVKELVALLNEHYFYLQLSIAEGFPNALCEAMLCGCIPIGSSVFGIPDIIGDNGFLLRTKSSIELRKLIENALSLDESNLSKKSKSCNDRIVTQFPLIKRKEKLFDLINTIR